MSKIWLWTACLVLCPLSVTLGQEPTYREIPLSRWARDLEDANPKTRALALRAIAAIGKLGGPKSIEGQVAALTKCLLDSDEGNRERAYRSLRYAGLAGFRGVIENLAQQLAPYKSFKDTKKAKNKEALEKTLNRPTQFLERQILSKEQLSSYRKELKTQLSHEHWSVRFASLLALDQCFVAKKHPMGKIDSIHECSKDSEVAVRLLSYRILAALKAKIAAPSKVTKLSLKKNEANAITKLRILNSSQAIFLERNPEQIYGTLSQLAKANLINKALASSKMMGYEFDIRLGDNKGESKEYIYQIHASPIKPGVTGKRWFFTDQSGVIRASTKGPANRKSVALGG